MYNDDLPPATGGHSPISSQSHFSPRLLTPDIDADHPHDYRPPMTVHSDGDEPDPTHAHGLSFAKQPIHPSRATSVKKGFAGVARDGSASSSRRTSGRGGHMGGTDGALSDGALSYALSGAVGRSSSAAPAISKGRDGDSDGQSHRGSPTKNGQVSLLSAIMTSPEHGSIKGLCRPHTAPVFCAPSAAHGDSRHLASYPSTALSSPTSTSAHGILRRTASHQTAVDVDGPTPADQPSESDQGKPHGILRRGSMSGTEAGLGPAFAHTHSNNTGRSIGTSKLLESKLIQADEKRVQAKEGRIGWADVVFRPETTGLARAPSTTSTTGRPALKFAVASKPAHAPSHGSTSASETGDASRRSSSSRRALSPFARERSAQEYMHDSDRPFDAPPSTANGVKEAEPSEEEEEEEEDDEDEDASPPANLPGYVLRPGSGAGLHVRPPDQSEQDEESDSSDAGYEEDEEDGMFSSDDETSGRILHGIRPSTKFPFARSTNYWNRRESREDASPGASPPAPSAPVFAPPPNRRGRGHVRVADTPLPRINTGGMTSGKEGGCTRHCSPPPQSRSRSSNAGIELEEEAETGQVIGRDGTKSALYGKVQEAPPAAASPSARRMKRPFDLPVSGQGKSQGKSKMAGSPMPPRLGDEEEDENEDEDEEEADLDEEDEDDVEQAEEAEIGVAGPSRGKPVRATGRGTGGAVSDHPDPTKSVAASYRSGWRSDDAAFYGPKSRVSRPASRNVSETAQGSFVSSSLARVAAGPKAAPMSDLTSSVFSETEDDTVRSTAEDIEGDTGVRGFIRRASEHLPMFRRSSVSNPSASYAQPTTAQVSLPATARAREPSAHAPTRTPISLPPSTVASPIPPPQVTIGTCQPILDDTPAKAEHAARAPDGGLAHRLEQTLGTSHQLGVASASMALQKSGSASSRPSTASRDSRDARDVGRLGEQKGGEGVGPVSYPQPRSAASSARPSLSTLGSAGTAPAPAILAAPSANLPSGTESASAAPLTSTTSKAPPPSALGRAPSLSSGKVTFATPAHIPRRSVSSAMGVEIIEEAKRRRETRAAGAAAAIQASGLQVRHAEKETKSAPIRCPKLIQTEDLGWTEGALLNIRKHVGKGEQGV